MIKEHLLTILIDAFRERVEKIVPVIEDTARKTGTEIKDDFINQYGEFLKKVKEDPQQNLKVEETELLDSSFLISVAKKYIVDNSNEVYVWKMCENDVERDVFYVHLAYGKDHELIEKSKNVFVLIKAQELSSDVKQLFKESELVILK
ncbi:MAG: hypothetical protein IKV67_03555 [Paludibacteraceae bacterium]|nr:hypothetical protein [Paludibacteraceae bacterium]